MESFKEDNKQEHEALVEKTREIIAHQKETNGSVKKNTAFRYKFQGGFGVIKWILGFVGAGNLVILLKLFLT